MTISKETSRHLKKNTEFQGYKAAPHRILEKSASQKFEGEEERNSWLSSHGELKQLRITLRIVIHFIMSHGAELKQRSRLSRQRRYVASSKYAKQTKTNRKSCVLVVRLLS